MKWLSENWFVLIVVGWLPALIAFASIEAYLKKRRKLRDPNTLVEVIDGKRYIVTEKERPLVRHAKTGRTAVLLSVGRERDPQMVAGRIVMKHRWIRVLRAGPGGAFGVARWARGDNWEVVGTTKYRELDPV